MYMYMYVEGLYVPIFLIPHHGYVSKYIYIPWLLGTEKKTGAVLSRVRQFQGVKKFLSVPSTNCTCQYG